MTLAQLFLLVKASTPADDADAGEVGTMSDLLAMQAAAQRGGLHG